MHKTPAVLNRKFGLRTMNKNTNALDKKCIQSYNLLGLRKKQDGGVLL